jgi:hypothetical protein
MESAKYSKRIKLNSKMKKLKICFSIATLFIICFKPVYSQEMSKEKAFFYEVKINRQIGCDTINNHWYEMYVMIFKSPKLPNGIDLVKREEKTFDYNQYKFDEAQSTLDNIDRSYKYVKPIVKTKVEKINFLDQFISKGTGELDEYDAESHTFPFKKCSWDVYLSMGSLLPFSIPISNFINLKDINNAFEIDSVQAKKFIESRKGSKGKIDRQVYLRVTYSVLDRKSPEKNSTYFAYCYSIEIFGDKRFSQKLGVIYPSVDYYDKVNGIKYKDEK